jgi:hypothetical protein
MTAINQINQLICLLVQRIIKEDHPAPQNDDLDLYGRIGIALVSDIEKQNAKDVIWKATGKKRKIRLI